MPEADRIFSSDNNIDRTQFLRGDWRGRYVPVRPPWSPDEEQFLEACDGCGDCIDVCPEKVLITGRGRYPQIEFQNGECSFCGKCEEVCNKNALRADYPQSRYQIALNESCLSMQGVMCRTCGDVCSPRAITFKLQAGGMARPELSDTQCNGCGACVAPCPVNAISVTLKPELSDLKNTGGA